MSKTTQFARDLSLSVLALAVWSQVERQIRNFRVNRHNALV